MIVHVCSVVLVNIIPNNNNNSNNNNHSNTQNNNNNNNTNTHNTNTNHPHHNNPSTPQSSTSSSPSSDNSIEITIDNFDDSRDILISSTNTIKIVTNAHYPDNPLEKKRIMSAGGVVV